MGEYKRLVGDGSGPGPGLGLVEFERATTRLRRGDALAATAPKV